MDELGHEKIIARMSHNFNCEEEHTLGTLEAITMETVFIIQNKSKNQTSLVFVYQYQSVSGEIDRGGVTILSK